MNGPNALKATSFGVAVPHSPRTYSRNAHPNARQAVQRSPRGEARTLHLSRRCPPMHLEGVRIRTTYGYVAGRPGCPKALDAPDRSIHALRRGDRHFGSTGPSHDGETCQSLPRTTMSGTSRRMPPRDRTQIPFAAIPPLSCLRPAAQMAKQRGSNSVHIRGYQAADGCNHSSAGDTVRTRFKKLKREIAKFYRGCIDSIHYELHLYNTILRLVYAQDSRPACPFQYIMRWGSLISNRGERVRRATMRRAMNTQQ